MSVRSPALDIRSPLTYPVASQAEFLISQRRKNTRRVYVYVQCFTTHFDQFAAMCERLSGVFDEMRMKSKTEEFFQKYLTEHATFYTHSLKSYTWFLLKSDRCSICK